MLPTPEGPISIAYVSQNTDALHVKYAPDSLEPIDWP